MTGKRNLFLGLLIGLALGGALPVFLSFHDWTSAQDSRTVLLRQGWNQLVWTADNQPADTALAAIAGDLVIAYGWQGDSQTFTRYIPNRADVSTMGEVEKNSGYWLLMTREVAFSFPTADGQQCPQPTPCPTSTPSPSCGDWQSLAEGCAVDYGQCMGTLTECTKEFGKCTFSLGCWRGCHLDLGSCWSFCHADLGSCWFNCHLALESCVLSAPSLALAQSCVIPGDCLYCNEIWDCLYCDEIWDCLYCDEIPES